MFTTRSASLPEPATRKAGFVPALQDHAVLLVGHGSSKQPAAAASLERHTQALRAMGTFAAVHTALLVGGAPPAQALRQIGHETIAVMPVMMCAGWTTAKMVPDALGLRGGSRPGHGTVVTCEPLGLHPGLARLIADRAADQAAAFGISTAAATLLLVAHGSQRSTASFDATERQAARLRAMGRFRTVRTAYLEQAPRPAHRPAAAVVPVIIAGLFAAPGHHATRDVAAALAACPRPFVRYLGPIGDDPGVAQLLWEIIADRMRMVHP
jgi:sirohydrochlorin cobaltochelatase